MKLFADEGAEELTHNLSIASCSSTVNSNNSFYSTKSGAEQAVAETEASDKLSIAPQTTSAITTHSANNTVEFESTLNWTESSVLSEELSPCLIGSVNAYLTSDKLNKETDHSDYSSYEAKTMDSCKGERQGSTTPAEQTSTAVQIMTVAMGSANTIQTNQRDNLSKQSSNLARTRGRRNTYC